ncbi:hypothetical protein MBAV_005931 [Candidatus Magnetobacterium bavaricum]|uniref:Apea-like HEPN domain-containing protein n=1 Tax=Candidatus Magnetobacterium bavaricum TaxID=29290 RepID=A0A0F3GIW8_9BACT|nr:hypothetical protein MBAV_005931 [Candidatus Magnetobacterium bavaricum]
MSVSTIISFWKERAEIDYVSVFVPLWLAFDAWIEDKYGKPTQRECLEALKDDTINNKTFNEMKALLNRDDSISNAFKNNLKQLDEALRSAPIYYKIKNDNKRLTLSFKNGLVDRKTFEYEDLFREKDDPDIIELVSGCFITDEIEKIYKAYIEILYQMRCSLFHGDLSMGDTNKRIVKYLYLTLKDLLKNI